MLCNFFLGFKDNQVAVSKHARIVMLCVKFQTRMIPLKATHSMETRTLSVGSQIHPA